MTSAKFDRHAWIGRLAQSLPALAQAQESFLREFQERHGCVIDLRDGRPPPFPLEDLRLLYGEVRNARFRGMEGHYAPLRAALDPVRHALLCHPALERVAVAGRLISDSDFWIAIPGSGGQVHAETLIAGLMARASELPDGGLRTAPRELDAFLSPIEDKAAMDGLGGLDEACDMFLFHGLALTERIEIGDSMALLPHEEVLRFLDRETVRDLAPSGAGLHGWRSVGAVARPFRWRPELRRRGGVNGPGQPPPTPFFQDAATFLDLLAVSHSTRIAPLAELPNRIDGSAGRLLGWQTQSLGFHRRWTAEGFDSRVAGPTICEAALAEARMAFRDRSSAGYAKMAPVVSRLSQALARNGRFALHDRITDISIALEGMYDLPRHGLTHALKTKVAEFLAGDGESRDQIGECVRAFYDARSAIVHHRQDSLTPEEMHAAFVSGFDIARRSLFKRLREGSPEEAAGCR